MSAPRPAPSRAWPNWPASWMCALIFFATLIAFWPALRGEFLWDDAGHVTRADLTSLDGLFRIWFEPGATQQYYPVLHSAFWIEHHLWGDAPLGYHLLNLLLHATGACLFAAVLRRLFDSGRVAEGHEQRRHAGVEWLAALLFALHPVCVESVAWIAEQKNTLSLVLYLCAALAYLRFDESRAPRFYWLAFTLFALALFTKTVTATLPAALLVIFWWQRGRLDLRRDVAPVLPWFALGAAAGLFTAHFERTLIGASGADFALSFVQRGLLAGRVVWFYLGKLVWPFDLMFIYPRWTIDVSDAQPWLFLLAILALLGALVWRARRDRGPLAALLLFGGTLFPALGFVNVYPFIFSFVADHFQYLASLAILALVAVGLARLPRFVPPLLFAGLGVLTWRQSEIYRDNETLFRATLASNPGAWMAHNNLGNVLVDSGRTAEAVPHFEAALRLRPNYAEGENNLGDCLNRLGRSAEAVPHLARALKLQPNYALAHSNLGVALMSLGRADDGMAQFREALRVNPRLPVAHFNLGLALAHSGRVTEAIAEFTEAVRLNPDYADAELNWGIGLALSDRASAALPHFERALELNPDNPGVRVGYGRVLTSLGRYDDAIAQLRAAVELAPTSAEAHLQLAEALRRIGKLDEAAQHFAEAQRLQGGASPNRN